MTANLVSTVVVNSRVCNLELERNNNQVQTTSKKIEHFIGTAYGAFRFTQMPGKVAAVFAEIATLGGAAEGTVKRLKDFGSVFTTAANGMTWSNWCKATFDVSEQVTKVCKYGEIVQADLPADNPRYLELAQSLISWISAGCYSIPSLLPGVKPILGPVANVTDLTNDFIESAQAMDEWTKADKLLSQNDNHETGVHLDQAYRANLESEKTLHLIGLAKSVIAVTAGILGLIGLIMGAAIVPPIVTVTMGLATCSLAIVKHFYKESMEFKPFSVENLHPVQP